MVFWSYYRGGHRRAEKTAVYYTIFAVGFFIFSIIMWAVAAGVLQGTRSNSGNQDIWGWSCVDNKRRDLYSEDVDYELVCRVQVSIPASSLKSHTNKTTVLGTHLLHHRNCRRNHHNRHLRHNLLPILLQAPTPQIHARPRQSAL